MNTENNATDPQANNGADGGAAGADIANGQPATVQDGSEVIGEGGEGAGDAGAGAGGDAGKAGGESGDGQDGAPEAYADFNLPEGFKLEGERKEQAITLFRELGLDQAGAQKAIDHFIATSGADESARAAAYDAQVQQMRDTWAGELKAQWAGDYDANIALARTAVQAVGDQKLIEAFEQHGWGNHPALASAFAFFGKMMREEPPAGVATQGAAGDKKPWDSMYPNM